MSYFNKDYLDFFKELAGNNHKDWFDANRKRYEKEVKQPFHAFISEILRRMKNEDPKIQMEPKEAIFRINRDIRFSKDKTPYKIHMSAAISRGGKKDFASPGIYVELTPEHARVYGGVYGPDKDQLYGIRAHIANNLDEFEKILNEKNFKKRFGTLRGEQNKIVPKEFREAAEKQPLILNKQFYYFGELPPEVILEDNLPDQIMDLYSDSSSIRNFLGKALEG